MDEINMNGNNNDTNYRYKIPQFDITIGGRGNGIYTTFNNISEISKCINHPPEIILKYIAAVTGSCHSKEHVLTGTHDVNILNQIILEYIKYLVMCPVCSIPETIPSVIGTKKNSSIKLSCSACKQESPVNNTNKHINKGIDIIVKYLNSGKELEINKGTMVLQSTKETDDDFNPFN
jgi:translation initiation factor 2 beta subunit (eIF-2beta)/eIF-5